MGVAHICLAKGYKLVIYSPNAMMPIKVEAFRTLGAEVNPVSVVPSSDPNNFIQLAKKHAQSLPNGFCTNQFDNLDTILSHVLHAGPEIWSQLDGKINAFTCASGAGST